MIEDKPGTILFTPARHHRARRHHLGGAVISLLAFVSVVLVFAAGSAGAIPGPACGWRTTGDSRDLCLHYELLLAERSEVFALASAITEPATRAAGVTTWVNTHRQGIALGDTVELCGILGREWAANCVRGAFPPQ